MIEEGEQTELVYYANSIYPPIQISFPKPLDEATLADVKAAIDLPELNHRSFHFIGKSGSEVLVDDDSKLPSNIGHFYVELRPDLAIEDEIYFVSGMKDVPQRLYPPSSVGMVDGRICVAHGGPADEDALAEKVKDVGGRFSLLMLSLEPEQITLGDVKLALNVVSDRYKFYCLVKGGDRGGRRVEFKDDDSKLPIYEGEDIVFYVSWRYHDGDAEFFKENGKRLPDEPTSSTEPKTDSS